LLYRNLIRKITQNSTIKQQIKLEERTQSTVQSIGNGKHVSIKMRVKLINWL